MRAGRLIPAPLPIRHVATGQKERARRVAAGPPFFARTVSYRKKSVTTTLALLTLIVKSATPSPFTSPAT